jgi:hypothetical protein
VSVLPGWDGWGFDGDNVEPLWTDEVAPGVSHWVLVCTDRGQHPRREVGELLDRRATDHGDLAAFVRPGAGRNTPESRRGRQYGQAYLLRTYAARSTAGGTIRPPKCKTCNRSPRIGQTRMGEALDRITEKLPDTRVIDVSWLD